MSKLIYNELYKIFHKKSTIVFFLLILFFMLTSTYVVNRYSYSSEQIYKSYIEEEEVIIDNYKERKDLNTDEKLEYIRALTNRDVYQFLIDRKYKDDSAEATYVTDTLSKYYNDLNAIAVYGEENYLVTKEEAKKNLEEGIKYLDNFKSMDLVKKDLENLNKEEVCASVKDEFCDKYFEQYKKVLQYRIDMSIPYSKNSASNRLENYILDYPTYLELKKNKDILREDEKSVYDDKVSFIELTDYYMEKKILNNDFETNYSWPELLAVPFTELVVILIPGLILIASSIISDEFEKGTIKQLLVKPYSRNKIFLSKFIACLITLIIISIYVMILNVISYALTYDIGDLSRYYVIYDYKLHKVVEINCFQYFLELMKSIPYMYIIMILIILLASVSFTSTALSGVVGFSLIIIPEILVGYITKYKWLAYLPFFTWDMSSYMFGGKAPFDSLNYKLQLMLNIGYIIGFIALNLIIFKKKDVKNQ